ncbi:hypothetical protein BDV97DRAFT_400232 [Delphinella strobiligena]|nr:hypothetical protein BDV97DRAFT_400232 [Delphinella strobiligena]
MRESAAHEGDDADVCNSGSACARLYGGSRQHLVQQGSIKVPQGSKRNELVALARKHSARLTNDNVASSASSAYGAATSFAGNQYAQVTDGAYSQAKYWFDWAKVQAGIGGEEAFEWRVKNVAPL